MPSDHMPDSGGRRSAVHPLSTEKAEQVEGAADTSLSVFSVITKGAYSSCSNHVKVSGRPRAQSLKTTEKKPHHCETGRGSCTGQGQGQGDLHVPCEGVRGCSALFCKSRFTVVNYGQVDAVHQSKEVKRYLLDQINSRERTSSDPTAQFRYSRLLPGPDPKETARTARRREDDVPEHAHVQFSDDEDVYKTMSTTDSNYSSRTSSSLDDVDPCLPEIARRGRAYAKRRQQRLITKTGQCNFVYTNMEPAGTRLLLYFRDMFTTLLDLKWRYNLLLLVLAFILSWVLFAVVWYTLAVSHGDTDLAKKDERCVVGVYDFTTALLFSIESQHTIGYGSRSITTACRFGMFVLMTQSVCGVLIQCVMTGIIFAKIARPKGRAETFLFSKKAVILQRDGHLWLMFRLGDMRRSQVICTSINAIMVTKKTTQEGEEIPLFYNKLKITTESEDDFFFMAWPVRVVHKIDKNSPLWEISAENLLVEDFEVIVILEGINETTGMTTQMRTSYLPSEIMWGHRFADLAACQNESGLFHIDYTRFHDTYPICMGEFSARDLKRRTESLRSLKPLLPKATIFSVESEL